MEKSGENSLDQMIQYIKQWLETNQRNQMAVRPLTDILEVLEWAKQTIDELQNAHSATERLGTLFVQFDKTYGTLIEFLPPAPQVNIEGIDRLASATTSLASSGLLGISGSVYPNMGPQWLAGRFNAFAKMQERHETISKVRKLLLKLEAKNSHPPNIVDEYDLMIEKGFYFRGNEIDQITSAGITMRNVLEHVNGKLLSLVAWSKGEKKKWSKMVEFLKADALAPIELAHISHK